MNSLSDDAIDKIITGTNFSETLKVYSVMPLFNLGSEWSDYRIVARDGNDKLVTGPGDDELLGGYGNDTFLTGYGYNDVEGGYGEDTLDYSWFGHFTSLDVDFGVNASLSRESTYAREFGIRFNDVFVSIENLIGSDFGDKLYGNSSANDIFGGFGDDALSGNGGADVLEGNEGLDSIYGGSGNDDLFGGANGDYLSGGNGDDDLFGGSGSDDLRGGLGSDFLTGGSGNDTFVFGNIADSTVSLSGRDVIKDFDQFHDQIDLSDIDAVSFLSGKQDFYFIGSDAFSDGGGELRYRFSGNKTIVEADTNGNARADFAITLKGIHYLSADDFIDVI